MQDYLVQTRLQVPKWALWLYFSFEKAEHKRAPLTIYWPSQMMEREEKNLSVLSAKAQLEYIPGGNPARIYSRG